MAAEFVRDAALTAVIFGFFASVWFGWAQEKPPAAWRKWLITGSALSVVSIVVGGLLTWRHWNGGNSFDSDTSRAFGIIVGIEFGLAGLGAGLLAWRGKKEFIPVWIALIVGLHLFPVAWLLNYPFVHVVAALVTIAALAAVPVARSRSLPVSAVNGAGAGTGLLLGAYFSFISVLLGG